jgi:hypothetical protein
MGEPHVISTLRDKRAELSGLIRDLERKIGQHRADLLHLDATMRIFAPECQPESTRARQQRTRNGWFEHGECVRLVCDILRDAPAPMATGDIASRLIERKGIPAGDERSRALVQKTILGSLNRAGGTVERMVVDGLVCWRVAA